MTYRGSVTCIAKEIGLKSMGDRGRHRPVDMRETRIKSSILHSTALGRHQKSIFVDMSWFMSWDAGEKHTEAPHYTRKMQVDREILWICFRKTHQDESFWVLQSQRAGMKIEALEPGNECYGTCQKTVGDCSFDTYLKRLWLWVDRRTSCWMRNIMLGW